MLLKFEIIWTRIGQVIKLQNDINISEENMLLEMIKIEKKAGVGEAHT